MEIIQIKIHENVDIIPVKWYNIITVIIKNLYKIYN